MAGEFAGVLPGELAAGGGDVVATLDALGDVDALGGEDAAEGADGFGRRTGEALAGVDPVEWDQVDDVGHAANQLGEGAGLLWGVRDVADEKVFERDFSPGGGLVEAHRGHDFGDGPAVVDGHEAVAYFVQRRVEREREVDGEVEGGELTNLGDQPDGADGEVAIG